MSDAASSPNDPVFPSDSADDEPARGPRGIQSVEVGGQLLKALARTGRRMRMTVLVDDSLIAGVVVRVGNTVLDGSAQGRLRLLAERLT